MNNKIDFIQMLVTDIVEEQEYFKEYEIQKNDYDEKRQNPRYYEHPYYKMRVPSKTKIKDDCKMIRRLASEISKEEI